MSFRLSLYNILVNRKAGIRYRYHRFHDGSTGFVRLLSWVYLFWLNFAYYVLMLRSLGKELGIEFREQKRLPVSKTESVIAAEDKHYMSASEMAERLCRYDAVSFDMFDTLIFRPLSEPADVFYFVGEKLGIIDFKRIRRLASAKTRQKKFESEGHTEVTLSEIWETLENDFGIDAHKGMAAEIETEKDLCYANPFMLEVWNAVRAKSKKIIVVSDMYMSSADMADILEMNGFTGFDKIYVSCEYRANKAKGDLFDAVKNDLGNVSIIHAGDNAISDWVNAKKHGFDVCNYPQANRNMLLYRPYDMSVLVGSAYRGIVCNHIYNGLKSYSPEYEFGYIYGGLFVLGYCNFIHEQAVKLNADRIFFLSRDGGILKKIYEKLYPDDDTVYVLWSRRAAALLTADENRYDYFRRFITHKTDQKYSIGEVMDSMDLGFLKGSLGKWKSFWDEKHAKMERFIPLSEDDELTHKNADCLKSFIEYHWSDVLKAYAPGREYAEKYLKKMTGSASNILAVDIGWAGSGAVSMSYMAEKVWKMPCRITGIVAGTNTLHNTEPDASESFLQSRRLISYMYSQSCNRDLLKIHDPGKDHNIYWELLLSSPEPCFAGFYSDGPVCGKCDVSPEFANGVRSGIEDFVNEYTERFKKYPYMMNISGRDAYAPMLLAMSHNAKYLKKISEKTGFEINVV